MQENSDKILQLIRMRGPLLPLDVSKALNTNVLFASAMLSELVDKGTIKLSNLKIGGSPLYYMPGQESRLQNYYSRLNDKERKAYDMLKQKQVLRDRALEPVIRVALRSIKDFAIPLQVNAGNVSEIFWKWYMTSDSEAEILIKQQLGLDQVKKKEVPQEEQVKEEQKEVKKPKEIKKQEKPHEKAEENLDIDHFIDKTDSFGEKIRKFFNENKIDVIESKTIRKKSDFEFIVRVPSAVGKINYLCMAKNKAKFNDKDLSSAYVHGQAKKLPVLFLITGELTKKANEMLEKEFKNITVKKI